MPGGAPQQSYYPSGVAPYGANIRGMPILNAYAGRVFYVSSAESQGDGAPGTFNRPLATIQGAFNKTQAARGDLIICKAGHAETISTATALAPSISNVTVLGLGAGAFRPNITLDTAGTTTIGVSASSINFQNMIFTANVASLTSLFTLTTAKDFGLIGCEFRDTSAALNFISIVTTNATDNAADGLYVHDCNWFGLGSTASTAFMSQGGSIDRLKIEYSYLANQVAANSGLILQSITTKILTNAQIRGNTCNFVGANAATGALMITTATTHTGIIANNLVYGARAAASAILVTASSGLKFSENYYQTAADKSGILLPANV